MSTRFKFSIQIMMIFKNHFSLISAGTEASTVKAARKGYIGKAKERPQQVKQVIDVVRSQGPVQAYRAVMKKLDAYSPLGYSCVGEVVAVAPEADSTSICAKIFSIFFLPSFEIGLIPGGNLVLFK